MQTTREQERAMFEGATMENRRREKALRDAIYAMRPACDECWFRLHDGCEQSRCSVWRMSQTWQQVLRMRRARKLDAWDWWTEAKNNDRLLFVDNTDAEEA